MACGTREEAATQPGTAGLAGAWRVTMPRSVRRFTTALTLAADGTRVTQFDSASEQRGATLGGGVWGPTGDREFALSFAAGRYDATTGDTTGIAKVQGKVLLAEAGDAWDGQIRDTTLDPSGRQLSRSALFRASATRIRIEPLA